jgi:2-keto-4-pentenoate hydratase/2-oxohepta-3-ene-1,7-dioic acid hydratase in catechol pathway
MQIVRFTLNGAVPVTAPDGLEVMYGIHERGFVYPIENPFSSQPLPPSEGAEPRYDAERILLLPPCAPTKIIGVGRNYADHAKELGNPVPAEPLLFLKPPSSLNASGRPVEYPAITQSLHFEGELGLVIGQRCRHLTRETAWDAIAGFTIVNDFTARDLQKADVQFTRGKGFDTFCPAGPWMVPAAEFDWTQHRVTTRVDGEIRQDAPLTDMIFTPDAILVAITRVMTLEPGDLIATGTPAGVGAVEPDSVVEVTISGIGTLTNRIVKG